MNLGKIFPVLLMAYSLSANAEIPMTESYLLGTWKVEFESLNRDGSAAKKLNTTWTFNNDGTLIGESIDSQANARVGKFRATLKYRIDDGKLYKQASPGRSKEEICSIQEKEETNMLLKCNNIYFFMTKK